MVDEGEAVEVGAAGYAAAVLVEVAVGVVMVDEGEAVEVGAAAVLVEVAVGVVVVEADGAGQAVEAGLLAPTPEIGPDNYASPRSTTSDGQ
ncbi:hypothetical protein NHX12_023986 [Muraenolepis orangiensis]|uniref:Uncharacterized protein n=1 Tax=Muraenolepis orangiensis TaxID=630683 RepID=A0A9Q0ELB5_9TELE|nr:hypothetical protein NHX12_023986 [Muraenolepis orangiensis]